VFIPLHIAIENVHSRFSWVCSWLSSGILFFFYCKIGRKVVYPTGNNAHQFQCQRLRSAGRLMLRQKVHHIFRTGRPTNLKLGTQMEDEDLHHQQAPWPQRSKVKVTSCDWQVLADKSITKCTRNTKIGRKVVHPTCNNMHKFQGQRQRSRSPGWHNVETWSASYLPNGKAYELQTWCTDGGWRSVSWWWTITSKVKG